MPWKPLIQTRRDIFPAFLYWKSGSPGRMGRIMLRKIWVLLGAVVLLSIAQASSEWSADEWIELTFSQASVSI